MKEFMELLKLILNFKLDSVLPCKFLGHLVFFTYAIIVDLFNLGLCSKDRVATAYPYQPRYCSSVGRASFKGPSLVQLY